MNCRFHFRTKAVERCPHCGVPLCDRCAAPNKCPACGKSKAVEKQRQSVTCTNHHDLTAQGECPGCRKPFCPACFHSSGLCQACAQERESNRPASQPRLSSPKQGHRPEGRRPRKGSSLKRNRAIGWVLLSVLVFFFGRWMWGNYSKLGSALDQHLRKQQAMQQKIKDLQHMQGKPGGGANDDLEAYLEQVEAQAKKSGKRNETDRLMAQLGEKTSSEEDAPARLPGEVNAVLRRNAPKSLKIWRFEEHQTQRRRMGYAPARWKIAIHSPAQGSRVRGLVTVQAQVDAAYPVSRAELHVDGRMDAIADHPPFRFDWATEGYPNGRHSLKVLVVDQAGESHSSAARTVTVAN